MTTVHGTITTPDGTHPVGASVSVTLVDGSGASVGGFVGESEVLGVVAAAVAGNGTWSVDLTPTGDITSLRGDTLYQVVERVPGVAPASCYIVVPASGTYWVGELQVPLPGTPHQPALYLPLAGGEMSGVVLLEDGSPAASEQWVLDNGGGGGGGGGTPSGTVVAETSYGQAAAAGAASTFSRGDHTHGSPALSSAAAGASAVGDTAAVGVATTPARADHRHSRESFGAVTAQTSYGAASGNGSAATPPRSDHTHGTPALPTPGAIGAELAGTADAAVAAHAGAGDPHPQYLTPADGAAAYDALGAAATAVAAHEADTTAVHGIADTSVLETTSGSTAKVSTHAAAGDPHGDRVDAASKYLPLVGGTLTGDLTIASDTATQHRLTATSYFETDSSGTAEVARYHASNPAGLTGNSAKTALGFYQDDISTTQSQVWLQTHDYLHWYNANTFLPAAVNTGTDRITVTGHGLPTSPGWKVTFSTTGTLPAPLAAATPYYAKRIDSATLEIYTDTGLTALVNLTTQGTGTHTITPDNLYNNNRHRHFSIEVSNADLATKNTRLSIPWGYDTTEIGVFQANFNVNSGKFRVLGAAGGFRQIVIGNTLSDNLTPDGTEGRWAIQADSTAEGGSNAGSDFRVTRFTDAGVAVDAPFFIKRSNGQIGVGGVTSPGATLDIGPGSATATARINRGATNQFGTFDFATASTSRWSIGLRNDSTNDFHFRNAAQGLTGLLLEDRATAPNLSLLTSTKSYGSGIGVIFIPNASTAPSGNPAGGFILYSDSSGIATVRSPSGAVAQVLPVGTGSGTVAAGDDSRITGALQKSTATTKGDLLVATGSGVITRRAVGSNGQVLTADSAQADGVKWAAAAGGMDQVYPVAGYGLLAASGVPEAFSQSGGISDGQLYATRTWIPAGVAITNLWVAVQTGGSYTSGSGNRLGLYDDTGAQVGLTPDDSTLWAAGGWRGGAVAGGPIAAQGSGRFVYILIGQVGFSGITIPYAVAGSGAPWFSAGVGVTKRRCLYTFAALPASFDPASYGTSSSFLPLVGVS